MAKQFISAGKTDPAQSTYKHIFILQNGENVFPLYGYSKPLLSNESSDKIRCLEAEIYRLVTNGYIFGKHIKYGSTTLSMEIFLNGKFYGKQDEKILTLFPDKYKFEKNPEFFMDMRLQTFLKRLYEQAKTGVFVKSELIHKAKEVKTDNLFDVSKKRFNTEAELCNYIIERKKEGKPEGRILDFYLKYRERWF